MHVLRITCTWRYQVVVQIKVSMKWKSSRILKLMETSTVQCRRSHRCHCVTQYRSSWPSWTDQWLTFTMRSKRLLDMLLKECDFVSSFVVRSVDSWTCSKLGAERRWCCLLHWSIPPSPSVTLTLTLTLTLTPTEIVENKLRACLLERKTFETDSQIQAFRFPPAPQCADT